ncbi:hypothetical protein TNCV_1251801 [Trichonephila clavipes]|nr:hypothetical protein TNCV_1251801 [Trichonephila clavipes]
MPLRRNRRQYEQLTDFDRGRIIGLREAGWSNTYRPPPRSQYGLLGVGNSGSHCTVAEGSVPTSRQGNLECDHVSSSVMNPDSVSVLMTTARVWRRTGQIVEQHTAISQGVTVWGAISWDTRSSLVVLQGTDSSQKRGRYFNADCATHAIKSHILSTG